MSCDACDKVQNIVFDKNIAETMPIAYYRIGIGNIAIVGCNKHVKEAIDKLNKNG